MAKLVDCPACGGLRHATRASCPHCDGPGFSGRGAGRALLTAALGGMAALTLACSYGVNASFSICRELPDGGAETPDASGCHPCTEEEFGPECVNGVVVPVDAGPADSGPDDGGPADG